MNSHWFSDVKHQVSHRSFLRLNTQGRAVCVERLIMTKTRWKSRLIDEIMIAGYDLKFDRTKDGIEITLYDSGSLLLAAKGRTWKEARESLFAGCAESETIMSKIWFYVDHPSCKVTLDWVI